MRLSTVVAVLALAGLSACGACGPRGAECTKMTDEQWVRKVGPLLDNVSQSLERFGAITMSAPLLSPVPYKPLEFELVKKADDYFNEAKTPQVSAATLQQSSLEFGVGLKFQGDKIAIEQFKIKNDQYEKDVAAYEAKQAIKAKAAELRAQAKIAEAEGKTPAEKLKAEAEAEEIRAAAMPGPDTRPTRPTPEATTLPTTDADLIPEATKAKGALNGTQLTQFMGLLGPDDVNATISNQSAIQIAAANVTTEAIFSLLGNPQDAASQFKDKKLLLGVSMVNIRPGSVTRQGYAGDVAMNVSYAWQPARADRKTDGKGLQQPSPMPAAPDGGWKPADPMATERAPLVFAVAPMIDADVIDLEFSYRRQRAMALKISAVLTAIGAKGQAGLFAEFADRLENDIATQNVSAAATSYSMAGGIFGFQIGPRLRALADPTQKKPKPAYTLERQSFPVLLIIGIDKADIAVQSATVGDKTVYLEPAISFRQTSRWIPIVSNSTHRISESDRLEWLTELNQAAAITEQYAASTKPTDENPKPCEQDTGGKKPAPNAEGGAGENKPQAGAAPAPSRFVDAAFRLDPLTKGVHGTDVVKKKNPRDGAVDYVKNRAALLAYEGVSSYAIQDIPIAVVNQLDGIKVDEPEKPKPVPQIADIAPRSLVVDGKTEYQVLVLGDVLGGVEAKHVSAFPSATVGAVTVNPGGSKAGFVLRFTPKEVTEAVTAYFTVSVPSPTDPKATITMITPPVQLVPAPEADAKPEATHQITIERTGPADAKGIIPTQSETLTVPKDAPAEVVKTFVEKDKPVPPPPQKKN